MGFRPNTMVTSSATGTTADLGRLFSLLIFMRAPNSSQNVNMELPPYERNGVVKPVRGNKRVIPAATKKSCIASNEVSEKAMS
jgi:hypothetical protein